MSVRTNLRPNPVIVNGDMSGNITSDPTILQSLTVGAYSYSWTGAAPIGVVTFEASNDYALNSDGTVKNAGTWTVMDVLFNGTIVSSVPLTGNSGNGLIDWSTGAYAIRTVYTRTSGTGVLNVIINGKVA